MRATASAQPPQPQQPLCIRWQSQIQICRAQEGLEDRLSEHAMGKRAREERDLGDAHDLVQSLLSLRFGSPAPEADAGMATDEDEGREEEEKDADMKSIKLPVETPSTPPMETPVTPRRARPPPAPAQSCEPESRATAASPPVQKRADLLMRTSLQAREVIFRAAVDVNEAVLLEMRRACGPGLRQDALHALNLVVVAELAKMCGIFESGTGAATTTTLICRVVREQIARLRSPKAAFEIVHAITEQMDSALKAKEVDKLIGSVFESMQHTFLVLRSLLLTKRRGGRGTPKNQHGGDAQSVIRRPGQLAAVFGTAHGSAGKRVCRPTLSPAAPQR